MELTTAQTIVAAILVLYTGKYVTHKIDFLQNYNIPDAVTGGVIAALVSSGLFLAFGIGLSFDLETRDALLVTFFTTIGLSTRFSTLVEGGKPLAILVVIVVMYLFAQNLTGMVAAVATQQAPEIGVLAGSVSLSGGHGTAIAWAPILSQDFGLANAMEIGIACATFGLVIGGLLGGPIARYLISHNKLAASGETELTVGVPHDSEGTKIDYQRMLNAILITCISIAIGSSLSEALAKIGLNMPTFVTCLFAGILLINFGPLIVRSFDWPVQSRSLSLISDVSLGLFLAMSLMSLQLWTLAGLGGPIMLMLLAQVVMTVLFVIFIIFPAMDKDYDAAVISAGFVGLALGATPTALANMTAVTERFGGSAKAFVIIPLVGALFVAVANAFIVQLFLSLL